MTDYRRELDQIVRMTCESVHTQPTTEEVHARFADALVLLDWACPHLAGSAELRYVRAQNDDLLAVRGESVHRATAGHEEWRRSNHARWDGIAWVRCTRAFDSAELPMLAQVEVPVHDGVPANTRWYHLRGRNHPIVVTVEQIREWQLAAAPAPTRTWLRELADYDDAQVSVRVVHDDGIVRDCPFSFPVLTVSCAGPVTMDELAHQRWHEYYGTPCPREQTWRDRELNGDSY